MLSFTPSIWLISPLYYIAWIATVYLASRGQVILATSVHLLFGVILILSGAVSQRPQLWRRGVLASLIGYTFDSSLVFVNLISFPQRSQLGALSPLWMTSLWFTFAILLNRELKWLLQRRSWAITLGLIGGPLSYLGGAQSGAMTIDSPLELAAVVIGIGWGGVMGLASHFWGSATQDHGDTTL